VVRCYEYNVSGDPNRPERLCASDDALGVRIAPSDGGETPVIIKMNWIDALREYAAKAGKPVDDLTNIEVGLAYAARLMELIEARMYQLTNSI